MMCVILGVASPVTGPESVLAGDDAAVPAVDMAAVPAVAGAPVVDAGRAATVAACRRCLASHYSLLCVFSMFVDFLVHNARLSQVFVVVNMWRNFPMLCGGSRYIRYSVCMYTVLYSMAYKCYSFSSCCINSFLGTGTFLYWLNDTGMVFSHKIPNV